MECATRKVTELSAEERRVYEAALGTVLRDDQQVTLQVAAAEQSPAAGILPPWCNVYAGMSDEEIEQLEAVILDRAVISRD
ncbi:MAG: hypothetical protein KY475_05040 [Planctomycetes bacterium]|nr:hypothetical protein [Planctomycetota bacterium]